MNRIDQLFKDKGKEILSVYFTAGYPKLSDTCKIVQCLEQAGADMIEIGFPFSDPVADGPVIQASSHKALENGMNLDVLFGQLEEIKSSSRIPKILMGYFNTVHQYGLERFLHRCVSAGIDGVILPDLPAHEYEANFKHIFEAAGIHFICLIAPNTPPERAKWLEELSKGFVYRLSMSSTTGTHISDILFKDIEKHNLSTDSSISRKPTLIGFGIHDRKTFLKACEQANGAIIGTEFIKRLSASSSDNFADLCNQFVNEIKGKP